METKDCLKEAAKDVVRGCVSFPLMYSLAVAATVEKVGGWVIDILDKVSDKGKRNSRNGRQK